MRPTSLQGKKYLGSEGHPSEKLRYFVKNIYQHLGKLILGKGRGAGLWYQYQGEITNLNIFG